MENFITAELPESFAAFEAAIAGLPFMPDRHLVSGDVDYFPKIRVRDMADVNRPYGERPIALPGARQTRAFFVMKEVIDNAPLDFRDVDDPLCSTRSPPARMSVSR